MTLRKFFTPFLLISLLLLPGTASAFSFTSGEAEEEVELTEEAAVIVEVEPVSIDARETIQVNKSMIFEVINAAENENVIYEWFFGDGNRQQGLEVVHSYAEPGEYEVTLLVREGEEEQTSMVHSVFVYERSYTLITNVSEKQERIANFVEGARNEDIAINLIEAYTSQSEFLEEEALKRQISENIAMLEETDIILVWTNGSSGLTVFSQVQKSLSDAAFFKDKDIIFFTDADFKSLENIARGDYQSVQPRNIVLTRGESDWALIDVESLEEFTGLLDQRGIQYSRVDEKLHLRPWNFVSFLVNTMIEKGVPTNTIRLVLMLSVIVTVVAFTKQVIGLSTLGVYTPSILALSFIALDIFYGLIFLFVILLTGTLTRLFLRRYRLLYIPRMAIVLSMVSFVILVMLFVGAYFEVSDIVGISVFPMLIMSTMVEKFVSIQSGKGLRSALTLVGEAVLVAIICYFVAEWSWLKLFMLGHPEMIFFFLGINIFLARWTGLRIMEYVRFSEIIRHAEE